MVSSAIHYQVSIFTKFDPCVTFSLVLVHHQKEQLKHFNGIWSFEPFVNFLLGLLFHYVFDYDYNSIESNHDYNRDYICFETS